MIDRTIKLLGLLAAVGVMGCKAPSAPDAKPAPEEMSPVAAPTQPTRAERADDSSAVPSAQKLPVAEDFQAETAAAIVQGNYRAELDALETELHAEAD